MKVLTIVGARPQFVKACVVSKAIAEYSNLSEVMVHTGQHFDENMSDIFFNQLNIPQPAYRLDVNGGNHGEMTGRMLWEIEKIICTERPDRVLVYGDTNSTLAGALAAAKLHVSVAHVEAGLRSFNMQMPEEINRILTDQISDILFCPTDTAVDNLTLEGFKHKPVSVHKVGDVMQDSAILFSEQAVPPSSLSLNGDFIFATIHRAENTDCEKRLGEIVKAINSVHHNLAPVIMPLHPRTNAAIRRAGYKLDATVIDPVGYLQALWLLKNCQLVMTDSGGLQKEAFFFGKACVTLRDQTEWVELVTHGANELVGAHEHKIIQAATKNYRRNIVDSSQLYGGGKASSRVAKLLSSCG